MCEKIKIVDNKKKRITSCTGYCFQFHSIQNLEREEKKIKETKIKRIGGRKEENTSGCSEKNVKQTKIKDSSHAKSELYSLILTSDRFTRVLWKLKLLWKLVLEKLRFTVNVTFDDNKHKRSGKEVSLVTGKTRHHLQIVKWDFWPSTNTYNNNKNTIYNCDAQTQTSKI